MFAGTPAQLSSFFQPGNGVSQRMLQGSRSLPKFPVMSVHRLRCMAVLLFLLCRPSPPHAQTSHHFYCIFCIIFSSQPFLHRKSARANALPA